MTLLVIDMLNDFFRQHAYLAEQRPRLVAAINTLAGAFRHHDQPVIWVRQEFAPDLHDASLEMRKHNLRVTVTTRYLDGAIAQLLPNREIVRMLES